MSTRAVVGRNGLRSRIHTRPSAGSVPALALVVALVSFPASAGGEPGLVAAQTAARPASVVSKVAALLRGVPQAGATLGWSSAPVVMEDYTDLQCPTCRQFALRSST